MSSSLGARPPAAAAAGASSSSSSSSSASANVDKDLQKYLQELPVSPDVLKLESEGRLVFDEEKCKAEYEFLPKTNRDPHSGDVVADKSFKIFVVGDKGVGKTTFCHLWNFGHAGEHSSTDKPHKYRGFYRSKDRQSAAVDVRLVDTPPEYFNDVTNSTWFKNANAIIFLMTLTAPSLEQWHMDLAKMCRAVERIRDATEPRFNTQMSCLLIRDDEIADHANFGVAGSLVFDKFKLRHTLFSNFNPSSNAPTRVRNLVYHFVKELEHCDFPDPVPSTLIFTEAPVEEKKKGGCCG